MSRVTIIGSGAIGCTVGAALIEAGQDVTFCARQVFSQVSVRKEEEPAKVFPAHVVTSEKVLAPADWVLLCVKAHQVPSVAIWLRAAVGPQTKVAVLQNGVEQRERAEPFVPPGTAIVPVVVELPVARIAPGQTIWRRRAQLSVPDDGAGKEFCSLFAGSFVTAEPDEDWITRAWAKLCLNAPSGAVLVLTGQPMRVFHKPGILGVALSVLKECIAVGRAEGAKLDDALIAQLTDYFMKAPPDEGNSMYADRMAGLPMEWDARNGVVMRKGARHAIPTPVSAALAPLLAALDP